MQHPDSQCPSTDYSLVAGDDTAPAAPPPVIDLTQSGQIDSLVEAVATQVYVTSGQLRDYYLIHAALTGQAYRSQDLVRRVFSPRSREETQLELHLV